MDPFFKDKAQRPPPSDATRPRAGGWLNSAFLRGLLVVVLPVLLFHALTLGAASVIAALEPELGLAGALLPATALALPVNQLAMFFVLLALLAHMREGLADLGWAGRMEPDFVLGQFAVAAITLLALSGFYRLVFIPGMGLATGQEPGFRAVFGLEGIEASGFIIIAVMVFSPLVGDSVYRGYALPRLASLAGRPGAAVISSLCFALLHAVLGVEAVIFAFATGLILSAVFMTIARERLWGLVMGHCLFNALLPVL